jgi:Ser/Thr protein kinase RdoA (MazF antagonist)
LHPLGSHGGFSGASLWRLETPAGNFALKAWPANWRAPADLAWIHGLMGQAAAHPWMPRVMATTGGPTFVELHGRLWEVVTWMPGGADFGQSPSPARLEAAATALAQLHQSWRTDGSPIEACPAALRRQAAWQAWNELIQTGWRPTFAPPDPYRQIAERLWQLVQLKLDAVPMMLSAWLNRKVPVQPCVCDLWHDHVLFTGDAVTGIVDFGSAKLDHVSVDLARLFGSLIGGDDAQWQIALAAYERVRPLSMPERLLARVLDRTGVLLAAANWLKWLYHENRVYPDAAAVIARLESLARRLAG